MSPWFLKNTGGEYFLTFLTSIKNVIRKEKLEIKKKI